VTAILLDGLWQGALIAAVAYALTLPLRRNEAATRYAMWFAALLALAIVPPLTLWHPLEQLPVAEPIRFAAAAPARAAANAADLAGAWVLALWLTGAALSLVRLVYSSIRIREILRNALPAPQCGDGVVLSDAVTLPIAAGLFKPRVVLPLQLPAVLDSIDLASVIAHERAHIRRGDVIGNLVQRIIEALLWFNPWTYVVGRALVREREAACDDRVVYGGGSADRYASCLTRLAHNAAYMRTPLLTPSAIGSRHMLVGRIARLLNGKAIYVNVNRPIVGAAVVLFGALAFVLQTADSLAQGDLRVAANDAPTTCDHAARVLTPAPPEFPDAARGKMAGVAVVDVLVKIAADGEVASTKVIKSSGNADIDAATVTAARASTYAPAMKNCKASGGSYVFQASFNPRV
jgi:TonB family protein